MKKSIFLIALIANIAIGSFTSCSNTEESTKEATTEAKKGEYSCPMKCEGEKTYDKEGSCPVCGMDLKKD